LTPPLDGTLSNANLTVAYGSSATRSGIAATIGMATGKFYWEVNSVDVAGKRSEPARGSFELSTDDSLKKLNPEDIKIISSDTIYRTENE
jgi:hypothetical protein